MKPLLFLAAIAGLQLSTVSPSLVAATKSWTGNVNGYWSTPGNWSGGVGPAAGDILSFPTVAASRRTITNNLILGSARFHSLHLDGSGYALHGAAIALTNGVIAHHVSGLNAIHCDLELQGAQSIQLEGSLDASLDLKGNLVLHGDSLALNTGGFDVLTISGRISGTGHVRKDGPGTVRFDGASANTFAGETVVADGLLELNRFILINGQPSPRVAIPGNLAIGSAGDDAFNGRVVCRQNNQIAASSEVSVAHHGKWDLADHNNSVASIVLNGGRIDTGIGILTLGGSNLVCLSRQSSLITGNLRLGDAPRLIAVEPSDSVLTISAVVSGGSGATLTKLGEGELRLTGPNTYAGSTVLRQGLLVVTASDGLGSGVNGVVVQSGAPVFVRDTQLILINATIAGKPLLIEKQGPAISTEGLTSIWSGPITLNEFATIETRGASQFRWSGAVTGPGGIFKRGPGQLVLASPGENSYAGFTRASEGTLILAKSNTVAIPGPMSVGEGVGLSAMVRLSNVSTIPGVTNQIADLATVEIRSTGSVITEHAERIGSLTGSGSLNLGAELEVGFDHRSGAFGGAISGVPGAVLHKIGAGALTLAGPSTQERSRVSAGTLIVNAPHSGTIHVGANGTLSGLGPVGRLVMEGGAFDPAPGSVGFRILGDIAPASAPSLFRFDLENASALSDRVTVGGQVHLANISLQLAPAPALTPGAQFKLIEKLGGGSAIASLFSGLAEGAVLNAGGQTFQVTYQGGNGNDVVLTRGASLVSSGLRHTTLGLATLSFGAPGELVVGQIGGSGEDGVLIPLDDAQGWQGRITALDPSAGKGALSWEVPGAVDGRMEVAPDGIRVLADTVAATAHWVEFYDGPKLALGTVTTTNAPVFRVIPPVDPWLETGLRVEGPYPGQPHWVSELSWATPRNLVVSNATETLLTNISRIRVRAWPQLNLPLLVGTGGPTRLLLRAAAIPEIRLAEEGLLFAPTPHHEGLPHRALGQAHVGISNRTVVLSNLGSSGHDGVSIQLGDRASGLGLVLQPFDLTPPSTTVSLQAVGVFGGAPEHSMGSARLITTATSVQAFADFRAVDSETVRTEVYRAGQLVGGATSTAGLAATMTASLSEGQGGLPSLDVVGWVPPGLLPYLDGIAQSAAEPLPCYLFHFDGPARFTLADGQEVVGDTLRLLSGQLQPRAQSLTRFELTAGVASPDRQLKLSVEKLRIPSPEVTRVFPTKLRPGETVEILGRGFGNSENDVCVIGSSTIAGHDQLAVPFEILHATDTRVIARMGWTPPGTLPGPIQVFRGVGNQGIPPTSTGAELRAPVWAWRESAPSAKPSIRAVYETPSLSSPPQPICADSGAPQNGVLIVRLGPELVGARVSFDALIQAVMPSGLAQVSASDVRFIGAADELEAAQRLAHLIETSFAQQAGLIVEAHATRPSADAMVTLTLRLPAGSITQGFLRVCATDVDFEFAIVDVFPSALSEGQLLTIGGRGFGTEVKDLMVILRDAQGRPSHPMQLLQASDNQILARVGPFPTGFESGKIEVTRGRGYLAKTGDAPVRQPQLAWEGNDRIAVSSNLVSIVSATVSPCLESTNHPPTILLPTTLPAGPATLRVRTNRRMLEFGIELPEADLGRQVAEMISALNDDRFSAPESFEFIAETQPGGGFVLRPKSDRALGVPAFDEARLDWFSICPAVAPKPSIARVTVVDDRVEIHGTGFGTAPEMWRALVVDGDGSRLFPLETLSSNPTRIVARSPAVPPDASPGQLILIHGRSSLEKARSSFADTTLGDGNQTWRGDRAATMFPVPIALRPTPRESGQDWIFSPPPTDGHLFMILDRDCPADAVLQITACLTDTEGGAWHLNTPAVRFLQSGNRLMCAERIADVIASVFWQQAALPVDVEVMLLGTGGVKIDVALVDGVLARGSLSLRIAQPPVITSIDLPRGKPGDVVNLFGHGFGTNPDRLWVHLGGSNGVSTSMPVVSATETQLVAIVGLVRPDAQAGRIVVARGKGSSVLPSGPTGIPSALTAWGADGEIRTRSGHVFDPIRPSPAFESASFFSFATNGAVCVEVEGDWPANVQVDVEFAFVPLGTPVLGGIYSSLMTGFINLPGGPAGTCAEAIAAAFDNFEAPFPVGMVRSSVTPAGANRYQITFSAEVPIDGVFNLSYTQPISFDGLTAQTLGLRAGLQIQTNGSLTITNLGNSGRDGLRVDLGHQNGGLRAILDWPNPPPNQARLLVAGFGGSASQAAPVPLPPIVLEWWGPNLRATVATSAGFDYERTLLRGGQVVNDQLHVSGHTTTLVKAPRTMQLRYTVDPYAFQLEFTDPLMMELPGGASVAADTLRIAYPAISQPFTHLSGLTITAANLAQFGVRRVMAIEALPVPMVAIRHQGSETEVFWTPPGVLEQAPSPEGPWIEMSPAPPGHSYVIPSPMPPAQFFRLRKTP